MGCAAATCDLLDLLSIAGIIVDQQGVALAVSEAAKRIIGPDIAVVDNRLVVRDQGNRTRLFDALQQAMENKGGVPTSLPLRRTEKRPLIANVVRMDCEDREPQFLIRVSDLEVRGRPTLEVLRSCFDLSPAEAKLASALIAGETLGEAAKSLNIKKETARTQLKSIMSKLGVSRQADFLVLAGKLQ